MPEGLRTEIPGSKISNLEISNPGISPVHISRNRISHHPIFSTLRFIAIATVVIAYAVLVHHVNSSGHTGALGAILALAPLLLLGAVMALRAESRIAGIIVLISIAATARLNWPLIEQHAGIIFWLQDISLLLVLFATFGRTLLAGRKPLCVGFAEAINGGQLPPSHRRYAYWVTVAWVVFFGVMAIISTLLFFGASMAVWSFFVNFLTLPLVALMFIVEYLARRHLLPDAPATDILAAVKAYRDMSLKPKSHPDRKY
jgi:uncharacterized membrane protein